MFVILRIELRIMQCDGATTKQLNILQLHKYYGRARTRSDLSRYVRTEFGLPRTAMYARMYVRTGF
jgi:hypothetical protein